MPASEIALVKVQKRQGGSFMVTIPSFAAKTLKISDNEEMKVLLDKDLKRVIFELVKR